MLAAIDLANEYGLDPSEVVVEVSRRDFRKLCRENGLDPDVYDEEVPYPTGLKACDRRDGRGMLAG